MLELLSESGQHMRIGKNALLEWGGTRRAAMERFHIQKYMGAGRQSTINKKDLK